MADQKELQLYCGHYNDRLFLSIWICVYVNFWMQQNTELKFYHHTHPIIVWASKCFQTKFMMQNLLLLSTIDNFCIHVVFHLLAVSKFENHLFNVLKWQSLSARVPGTGTKTTTTSPCERCYLFNLESTKTAGNNVEMLNQLIFSICFAVCSGWK